MNTKLLRQKILDLAIRGKLTEQKKSDGTTKDLLVSIAASSACHSERSAKSAKSSRVILSKRSASKDLAKEIIPLDKSEAPFEIPENWEWVRLGDVCEKITDGTHHSPINTETGDFMYVTAKNIKDEGVATEGITYVSAEVHKEIYARCAPEKGDVLLIKDGATTGVVTVNNIDEPFSLLSSVALLKPGKFFESWFLAFVIRSSLFNTMIRSQMKGVGITRVTLSQINSFELPLPPLAEQQRIVTAIENAFAEITEIENNQELLKKHIKQGRQKILDLAIRGKLTQQLKTDGTTKDLLAQMSFPAPTGNLVTSSSKKKGKSIEPKQIVPLDKTTAPFEIPENWEWVKLGDICDISSAKRVLQEDWKDSGIPFYRAREIAQLANGEKVKDDLFITKELYQSLKAKYGVPQSEDILMSAVGTIGKTYIVKETDQFYYKDASVICLKKKSSQILAKFLKVLLASDFLQKQMYANSSGTTVDTITISVAQEYVLPLPPLAEQQRIVATIEQSFAEFDSMEESLL